MFGIPQMQIDWGKQQTRAGAKITKEQRNKQECQIYKKTNTKCKNICLAHPQIPF